MSLNRDAMYAAFEQSPGDLTGYGAMADELEDLSYASIAHAFRWMSRRGVWPHRRENYAARGVKGRKVPQRFRWAWYQQFWDVKSEKAEVPGVLPVGKWIRHALPHLLMVGEQKVFPSHQAAVMWLAGQLAQLKSTWDIDDPKRVVIAPDPVDLRKPPIMVAHGDEVNE